MASRYVGIAPNLGERWPSRLVATASAEVGQVAEMTMLDKTEQSDRPKPPNEKGRKVATARHCRRDPACAYRAIPDGWPGHAPGDPGKSRNFVPNMIRCHWAPLMTAPAFI